MTRIPPVPSSSGQPSRSNSNVRQPPSDAFNPAGSSSNGGGGGGYPSFNDMQQQAATSSPRRPTRSMRRPHQPSSSITSGREVARSPSPDGSMSRRPTWEEERAEREDAAALPSQGPPASGSDVFRAAQVGKAFSSAARDRQASESSAAAARKRQASLDVDPDLEGDFGGQFNGIDDILRRIRGEYSVVMQPEFNPIPLALGLLESEPNALYNFQDLSDALLSSLQSTVQTHSASFASSISTHNSFLASLNQSQQEVRQTKAMLVETKEALRGEKRAEINALSSRGRAIKDMMDTLDTIEHLKAIPEQLETLLSEKRLLLAALVLVRSVKTLNKPALSEIGALADLRNYFSLQEVTIRDILLEELHNHIYLKSYYCEGRWAPYARGQTKLQDPPTGATVAERSLSSQEPNTPPSAPDGQATSGASALSEKPVAMSRYLLDLAMRPSQDPLLDLPEDLDLTSPAFTTPALARGGLSLASGSSSLAGFASLAAAGGKAFNPEADSFVYIEHLLEALAVLGRLGWALDALSQRESLEVFSLVDGTIQEVEERSVDRRRQTMMNLFPTSTSFLPPPPSAAAVEDGRGAAEDKSQQATAVVGKLDEDAETLRDLFWTMYSKLDAVLQGLRVTSEVASRIGSRKDFKDNSYSMLRNGAGLDNADVWKPIQAEVKGLLHEYLTSNSAAAMAGRNAVSSVNDILRDGKSSRDRSKNLFRFNDSDSKATKRTLKKHDDELSRALRASLPGLVGALTDAAGDRVANGTSLDDKAEGGVGSHRLLVAPNAHLVSIVFGPTLAFLTRVASVLPINLESENFGLETYVKAAYETPAISVNGS